MQEQTAQRTSLHCFGLLYSRFSSLKKVYYHLKRKINLFLSHIENIIVYLPAVNSCKKIECSIKNNFKQ